jgi:hypothetical protein
MNQFMRKLFEIFKNKMLLEKIHRHIRIVMDHNYMIQILLFNKHELLVLWKILYKKFENLIFFIDYYYLESTYVGYFDNDD